MKFVYRCDLCAVSPLLGKFVRYFGMFFHISGWHFFLEFDLDSFARNLSLQQLNKCKKVNLMLIAYVFDM